MHCPELMHTEYCMEIEVKRFWRLFTALRILSNVLHELLTGHVSCHALSREVENYDSFHHIELFYNKEAPLF